MGQGPGSLPHFPGGERTGSTTGAQEGALRGTGSTWGHPTTTVRQVRPLPSVAQLRCRCEDGSWPASSPAGRREGKGGPFSVRRPDGACVFSISGCIRSVTRSFLFQPFKNVKALLIQRALNKQVACRLAPAGTALSRFSH